MARKFLYIIAVLIGLVIAAAFAYRLFGLQLMQMAMVPSATFEKPKGDNAYDSAQLWIARPDIAGNPSLWLPPGVDAAPAGKAAARPGTSRQPGAECPGRESESGTSDAGFDRTRRTIAAFAKRSKAGAAGNVAGDPDTVLSLAPATVG